MMVARPAKKYSQAARVHDIIRLMESRHGVTVSELIDETNVHRRTIHRDLQAIQDAGYPLESFWQGNHKLYRFVTKFKDIPPISFTLNELMSLYLLRTQGEQIRGTPFHDDLESIFGKIRSVLPPRNAAHLERIATAAFPLLQGRRLYSNCDAIVDKLRHALLFQQKVTITYRAQGRKENTDYELDPYTIALYKGGLYIIGYVHERKAIRTFAMERIQAAKAYSERFEIPESYHPEERLGKGFGIVAENEVRVKVRFDHEIAESLLHREWHPTQQMTLFDDGSAEIVFTAGGKLEILAWVLSYGIHAELLEPAAWRCELAATACSMAATYSE